MPGSPTRHTRIALPRSRSAIAWASACSSRRLPISMPAIVPHRLLRPGAAPCPWHSPEVAASRLAIDLGSFGTLAAVDVGDSEPRRQPLTASGRTLRTVVAISPSGRLVAGERAAAILAADPTQGIAAPLRLVEDAVEVTAIGTRVVRTRDVLAALLDAVVEQLPAGLSPAELILAVPLAWDDRRRALVVEAAQRLLREHAAVRSAAIGRASGHERGGDGPMLVVDVGHEHVQGAIPDRGVTASRRGGGAVFDDALFAWALAELAADPRADRSAVAAVSSGDPGDGFLAVAALAFREALRGSLPVIGNAVSADVHVPAQFGAIATLTLGRDDVAPLAGPVVETVELVVDDLLAAADLDDAEVGRVIALGDASAAPAIRHHLHARFGRRFGMLAEPKVPTARGALLVPAT